MLNYIDRRKQYCSNNIFNFFFIFEISALRAIRYYFLLVLRLSRADVGKQKVRFYEFSENDSKTFDANTAQQCSVVEWFGEPFL